MEGPKLWCIRLLERSGLNIEVKKLVILFYLFFFRIRSRIGKNYKFASD